MSDRLQAQCIALAGALAEAGVRDLSLHTPLGHTTLIPAHTDLPGLLLSAPPGATLHAKTTDPPMTLVVERHADRLSIAHAIGDAAARIAQAINA